MYRYVGLQNCALKEYKYFLEYFLFYHLLSSFCGLVGTVWNFFTTFVLYNKIGIIYR